MSSLDELAALPDNFSGVVRLFPLPNLVMFPHALLPLHIYEPRYRRMLEDALADDQLLAMSLLQPGWEASCCWDCGGRP
jgi:Lon protease-like protein